MEINDVATFGQQIVRLGLVDAEQLQDAQHEAGGRKADLQQLMRTLERKGLMTNWQIGKVLKGDEDGFIYSGYRVRYKIASGSFGRVFRAEDPRSGGSVAIKVLRRRWSEDKQRIDLFVREGRVGLSLKHPNIVEVLAINQDPLSGQYYIIMEFVEGDNLREILAIRKKFAPAEALRILEDAAAGLVYAYARGMTHRDIKLTNILISSQGEAKLVDFGLAQFFTDKAHKDEKVDRTVDYAGLEKATGVKTGDVRSDIYFLGCVLYEMLTGRSPIVMTRDRHARMRKQRFEEVEPIQPGEIDAPPSVYSLVETAMALAPQRRYQTPAQLLDATKAARREVEGGTDNGGRPTARTVFIVESDEHLQEALRGKFKDHGFRVFLASDPALALGRFRQQPYDALVVDASTTGEDGMLVYERIVAESLLKRIPCAAVVILGENQAAWAGRAPASPRAAALVRPVTFKQLYHKLETLLSASGRKGAAAQERASAE